MAQVNIEELRKVFPKGTVAVDDVSFNVNDGEFCVILGPSGCGKTTVLRLIAGLEEVTSGKIYIGDRLVNDIAPKDRDVAMVFQNYALYPHMTVFNNMAFGLKMRKIKKEIIKDRVVNAAGILGIEHLLLRKPKELSGGERQRVALGRALVRNPKVFLFDEPLSNLDANLRVKMRAELAQLHRTLGVTALYVTHDQTEAMTLGEKIVVLNKGRVYQISPPLELYHRPNNRFVASFIGSPPMNFFDGELKEEGEQLVFQNVDFKLSIPEEKRKTIIDRGVEAEVTLGVRPEDISTKKENNNYYLLRAKVVLKETLGDDVLVYYSTENNQFISKTSFDNAPGEEDTVDIYIAPHKFHIFSRKTGENISIE